jgi:hypothetical protein
MNGASNLYNINPEEVSKIASTEKKGGKIEVTENNRKPYDGNSVLSRSKVDSFKTLKACDGQLKRIHLRASKLQKFKVELHSTYKQTNDDEIQLNCVLNDEKHTEELSELKSYKHIIEDHKIQIINKTKEKVQNHKFESFNW